MQTKTPRLGRFYLLTAAVFAATAIWLAFAVQQTGAGRFPNWWIVGLFAALVMASENLSLLLPSRVTLSPQLILVMAAVSVLRGPGVVLGTLIIGGAGSLVVRAFRSRRYGPILFNLGQMALAAGTAATVFGALSGAGVPPVVTYGATVLSYTAVNFGLVVTASVFRLGTSLRSLWTDMRMSEINDFLFGVVGLLLGDLYRHVGPVALVAVIAPSLAARTVFTSAVKFRQTYHRLELLYSFTRQIERSSGQADVVTAVLRQFRSLLDVDVAEFAALGPRGWRRTTLGPNSDKPVTRDVANAETLVAAVEAGPVLGEQAPTEIQAQLTSEGRTSAMITPLLVDGALIGVLTVADPMADRPFTLEDLKLVETLANHAAVSLEHTRLLDQVRFDARHDPLTGLPNRYRFNEFVDETAGPLAVLLIDLDRFKEINDTLGHHHGDLLLRSVGERMSEELGHRGVVARLGGDEFGVLLPNTGGGDAAQAAVLLLAALEQPFQVGELQLEITGSIGVAATASADGDNAKLLQQADVAMYMAKTAHSGWELYTPERDHYSPRRLALAGELRRAIEADELEVHYQPKAELRTGRVVGVEALVRWQHRTFGLLSPDVFIPLAEHVGLIRPLTLKVLDAAIDEQHRLHDRGFAVKMAVNISVRSVLDVNLPDQVAAVLGAHGMDAADLTLEITESSVMADPGRTIGILGRLDALGVCISVDDFGTGYSSLSYLKRLPVSEMKIDRSFVSGLLNDDSDAAIVRSTVDLARNLGLRVVAEGVEDRATWTKLAALGCDEAQGFFVSAPLPPEALRAWIERTNLAIDPFL
ncbi:MAG: bifunctional diguanylate cyclase/phosphodiesterase [Actinomycetota bacterium]|nr:bifunctional diguanylate cyclase/phosphodiesterase [Actinomycetota bacterium]